jgi:hypothetical protein
MLFSAGQCIGMKMQNLSSGEDGNQRQTENHQPPGCYN